MSTPSVLVIRQPASAGRKPVPSQAAGSHCKVWRRCKKAEDECYRCAEGNCHWRPSQGIEVCSFQNTCTQITTFDLFVVHSIAYFPHLSPHSTTLAVVCSERVKLAFAGVIGRRLRRPSLPSTLTSSRAWRMWSPSRSACPQRRSRACWSLLSPRAPPWSC